MSNELYSNLLVFFSSNIFLQAYLSTRLISKSHVAITGIKKRYCKQNNTDITFVNNGDENIIIHNSL